MKYQHLFLMLLFISLGQGCASTNSTPQQPGRAFNTPDEAVNAVVAAARDHSADQLKQILGGSSGDIISSGDPVADRNTLDDFVKHYDEKHQLATEADGSVTLVMGSNDWPMPISLVKDDKTGMWRFDTARGKDEILNRRIGRDELNTIDACMAVTDAQREYASRDPQNAGLPVYAEKFMSDPGKKNGLYWETSPGESPSPLWALASSAKERGYSRSETSQPQPFYGYYYRMLKAQGSHADGGARNYVINGQMVGGFGVVAYPAEYGNSGVMTFIVNHDGIVYQRDLGKDTAKIANTMTEFDPGPGWQKIGEAESNK